MKDADNVIRQELQRAEVELAALHRQAEGVAAKIKELEAAVVGLRYVLRRRGSVDDRPSDNAWGRLTRPKAIERVLGAATEPMTPATIARELGSHGRRGDKPANVSGALYKMRMAGKAEPMPNGQGWIWLGRAEEESLDDRGGAERPGTSSADRSESVGVGGQPPS